MAQPSMIEAPDILHRLFEEAYNDRDLDRLVSLYEVNAMLAAAPGIIARGHAEIRTALVQYMAAGRSIEMETTLVLDTGEGLAMLNGKWHLNGIGPDGAPIEMNGSNSELVRRQPDGRWLFLVDNPFSA